MKKLVLSLFILVSISTFATNPKDVNPVAIKIQLVNFLDLDQENQEEKLPSVRNWKITCLGGGTVTTVYVTGTGDDARAAAYSNCGDSWQIRGAD